MSCDAVHIGCSMCVHDAGEARGTGWRCSLFEAGGKLNILCVVTCCLNSGQRRGGIHALSRILQRINRHAVLVFRYEAEMIHIHI